MAVGKTKVLLAIAASVLFAVTAWFSASTFSSSPEKQASHILQSHLRISFSSTVVILRVLQGLTSTLTAIVIDQSFEGVQWMLASHDSGVELLNFVRLSPATGIFGLIKLLFRGVRHQSDRAWAVLRLFTAALLFVASLALFFRTSAVTSYSTGDTLRVVAGTGSFNGSWVGPFLQSIDNVVPYLALASTYNFVTNPLFSVPSHPISCSENDELCSSYLFPGGTYLMYPQPSPQQQQTRDSVIIIHDAPATQLDFSQGLVAGDTFLQGDCAAYGSDNSIVGVVLCLAPSQASPGSVNAGIFACTAGVKDDSCLKSQPGRVPNVTTTMTMYNRRATAVCAASNNSILSTYDLGIPQQDLAINITGLQMAMGWLLNYTASGLPIESSLNFWFWFDPSGTYDSIWQANTYTTLKSTLSFIIWEFCTNNNQNPNVKPEQTGGQPLLSEAFQTTASLCQPYTRFVLNRAAFISYLVLECLALGFCWSVLVWRFVSGDQDLVVSSYPLIDFASKLNQKTATESPHPLALRHLIRLESDDKEAMRSLTGIQVMIARHKGDIIQPDPASLAPPLADEASHEDSAEQLHMTYEADRDLVQTPAHPSEDAEKEGASHSNPSAPGSDLSHVQTVGTNEPSTTIANHAAPNNGSPGATPTLVTSSVQATALDSINLAAAEGQQT